ncbi:MAG: hypothetical protein ABJC62_13705 [Frankiaceae bacterium]
MSGTICLQGGAEFGSQCREMDAALLAEVGGPVVVVALAARPGREYAAAAYNGVRHFTALGAEAVAAPDHWSDPAAALAAVADAGLLVLPGGSPSRLRSALLDTSMGTAVADLLRGGGAVLGASAGAMVLGEWMWLPDGGERVVRGLGHVPGVLVVPHYTGLPTPVSAPAGIDLLGLPECSGVVVRSGRMQAVGVRPAVRIGPDGQEHPV